MAADHKLWLAIKSDGRWDVKHGLFGTLHRLEAAPTSEPNTSILLSEMLGIGWIRTRYHIREESAVGAGDGLAEMDMRSADGLFTEYRSMTNIGNHFQDGAIRSLQKGQTFNESGCWDRAMYYDMCGYKVYWTSSPAWTGFLG